jgi:hypothetical protein
LKSNLKSKAGSGQRSGSVKRSVLVLLIVGLIASLLSRATYADDLYDVRIEVASRSVEDRKLGASEGLRVMLSRLSGQVKLPPGSVEVRRALAAPDRYYSQYRYMTTDRYDELGQSITELWLRYSANAVRRLLDEASLPLWTLNRPTLVVWLVERAGSGTDMVGDPLHPVLRQVAARAALRGLPLVIPKMDAIDLAAVDARDLSRTNISVLSAASHRYGAELMLIGRAEQLDADNWRVSWTSWNQGESRNISRAGSAAVVAKAPIDLVTDALVRRFTVAAGQAGILRVRVRGIDSIGDYAALLDYLGGLSYVQGVNVVSLVAPDLVVDIATGTDGQRFMELLKIESRLVAQAQEPGARGAYVPPAGLETYDRPTASEALRVEWRG